MISVIHLEVAPAPDDDPYKRTPPAPEPIESTAEEESETEEGKLWEIESLIRRRVDGRKGTQHLRWVACGLEEDEWIHELHLKETAPLLLLAEWKEANLEED